jgi:hypothetical protein
VCPSCGTEEDISVLAWVDPKSLVFDCKFTGADTYCTRCGLVKGEPVTFEDFREDQLADKGLEQAKARKEGTS